MGDSSAFSTGVIHIVSTINGVRRFLTDKDSVTADGGVAIAFYDGRASHGNQGLTIARQGTIKGTYHVNCNIILLQILLELWYIDLGDVQIQVQYGFLAVCVSVQ